MNTELHLVRFLVLALAFCKLFLRVAVAEGEISEEDKIIKDCNGILYRLMVDSGEPPFPDTACDVKQKVIDCFEERQGSGILLDKDRFLLLQSSIVDKALMCPNSNFEQLEQSIQNSATVQQLLLQHPKITIPLMGPEDCAKMIHLKCEKKLFDQMVVEHLPWPKTTKWRQCYDEYMKQTQCASSILEKYSNLQKYFGENLRQWEYTSGLFGIFMNDHHESTLKLIVGR